MTLRRKRVDTLAAVVAIPGAVAVVTTIPIGIVAFALALIISIVVWVFTG